jgi:hypothetical protein
MSGQAAQHDASDGRNTIRRHDSLRDRPRPIRANLSEQTLHRAHPWHEPVGQKERQ